MLRKLLLSVILIFLLINPVSAVTIRENKEAWTCYDYSIDYYKSNPDFPPVTISDNQYFKGVSHMVNGKLEGNNLIVHDGLYELDYIMYDYKNYYFCHFWYNTKPVRNYKFLWDNSP
jgi:hypothetical protein